VGAEAAGLRPCAVHRRRDDPVAIARALGPPDLELARRGFVPFWPQEKAGAVEQALPRVEVGAAHRQVARVYLAGHSERTHAGRRAPGMLVRLLDRDGPAAALGADRHD